MEKDIFHAERGGFVKGNFYTDKNGVPCAEIEAVHVAENFKKKGLGVRLIKAFIGMVKGRAKRVHLDAVPLDETTDPQKLKEFYKKSGFKFGGTEGMLNLEE